MSLIQNHIDALINNYKSAFLDIKTLSSFPLFVFLSSVITAFFTKSSLYKKEKIFFITYFKFFIIFLIVTSLYKFPLRYWFLTGLQSFHLITAAISLSIIAKYKLGKIAIFILLIFTSFYLWQRLNLLYFNPPDTGGVAKVKGKLNAIDYIYKDSKGEKFGLLIFTPPVLTDAYDYLIWWHGQRTYNYLPHSEKKGLFYLLIEPDDQQPWTYNGWLETVVKTGEIIETKTLPSGFIIQKRMEKKAE